MGVLSGLEPQRVFYYFEEITRIPHGSGNVERISNYLVDFAKKHKLFYLQDELKNVIMIKEASIGYEKEPPVILQGHMDMVAVKKPDCNIDMRTEGLKASVCGDRVYAEGTSLGGDDGIAVAYALALLESDTIRHPRLEVVITVDEEVGMDGAREIDLSMLKGKRMLNLDSEDEGIFLTGCAGGVRQKCSLVLNREKRTGAAFEITVGGLLGGHSGGEIHKERGNAISLLARVLWRLTRKLSVSLLEAEGGLADNAIPRESRAVVVIDEGERAAFEELVRSTEEEAVEELAGKDSKVFIRASKIGEGAYLCATAADTGRAAGFLWALPNGVQAMSADIAGLVETSLNQGILKYQENILTVELSLRSSVESAKRALAERVAAITGLSGGTYTLSGDYPGWKYRVHSPLREKMTAVYEEMYGEKPKVEAIHAGLECGLLANKIKDLDCVSIGPQISDIHTTEETLSVSSTARVWEFLLKLLETKDIVPGRQNEA